MALLQDGPIVIYPILDLFEVPALVMSIKIRPRARWTAEAYEQRRHVTPALKCNA